MLWWDWNQTESMDVRLQLTKRPTNFPFRRSGTGDQHSAELEQIKVSPLMRRRYVGRVVKEKGTQSQMGCRPGWFEHFFLKLLKIIWLIRKLNQIKKFIKIVQYIKWGIKVFELLNIILQWTKFSMSCNLIGGQWGHALLKLTYFPTAYIFLY